MKCQSQQKTVVAHTYKLRRGEEDAVLIDNPMLLRGEPIVVYCNDGTTKMKVGDGKTCFRDLDWIGDEYVYSAKSSLSFPNMGKPNVIYKEESTATLWQWNSETLIYEPLLGSGGSADIITPDDIVGLDAVIENKIQDETKARIVSELKLKNELETIIETKADADSVYTKEEVYTQEEVNNIIEDMSSVSYEEISGGTVEDIFGDI